MSTYPLETILFFFYQHISLCTFPKIYSQCLQLTVTVCVSGAVVQHVITFALEASPGHTPLLIFL